MLTCEDADLVRRRGRWLSHRIMEIYVQEISALQLYPNLCESTKYNVLLGVQAFHELLPHVLFLARTKVPERLWYTMFSAGMHA